MKALELGRLRKLEPKVAVQRDQWEKPGDMIHVHTKQLACFERVGHWIAGDSRQVWSRGAGYGTVHLANVVCGFREAVDATHQATMEVLPD